MIYNYNWINKLDYNNRNKIRKMFINGVSVSDISKKFNVDRSTIYYHIEDLKQFKNKKVEEEITKEEIKIDKRKQVPIKYIKIKFPKAKTYNDYIKEEKKKKKLKNDCSHRFWTKRCEKCYNILETESAIKEIIGKCAHTNWNKKCSGCGKKLILN